MRRNVGTAVAIIAAAFMVSFASAPARADNCSATCETSCAVCCSEWTLLAVCDGGRTEEEGSFDSIGAARTAADAATTGRRAPMACGSVRATWSAHCAADKRIHASYDTPATARAIDARGRAHKQLRSLDAAEQSLRRLATDRILTAKGQKDVAAANDAARALRQDLVLARQQAAMAIPRDKPDAELAALDEREGQLDTKASAVTAQIRAVVEDPAVIDVAAEAKAKRIAEQEAAAAAQAAERDRQRAEATRAEEARKQERAKAIADAQERQRNAADLARADAAERARKAAEATEQARSAAEAKRVEEADRARQAVALAAAAKLAEDTRRKDEAERKRQQEEQARRAALASSAADAEGKFSKEHEKAMTQLTTSVDDCSAMIAQMTMLELQPNVLPTVKTQAGLTKVALQNQKDKLRLHLVKVRALKDRQPRDTALQELHQAERESENLTGEASALLAKAKALH